MHSRKLRDRPNQLVLHVHRTRRALADAKIPSVDSVSVRGIICDLHPLVESPAAAAGGDGSRSDLYLFIKIERSASGRWGDARLGRRTDLRRCRRSNPPCEYIPTTCRRDRDSPDGRRGPDRGRDVPYRGPDLTIASRIPDLLAAPVSEATAFLPCVNGLRNRSYWGALPARRPRARARAGTAVQSDRKRPRQVFL